MWVVIIEWAALRQRVISLQLTIPGPRVLEQSVLRCTDLALEQHGLAIRNVLGAGNRLELLQFTGRQICRRDTILSLRHGTWHDQDEALVEQEGRSKS